MEPRYFDVPAGPAEMGVRTFARQAEMSVVYDPGSLKHFKTKAVKGRYLPIEALRVLLSGSGLDFMLTTPRFISIHPGQHPGPSSHDEESMETVQIAASASLTASDLPAGVIVRTINSEELSRQGFTTIPDWAQSLTQNEGIGANEGTSFLNEALSNIAFGSGLNLYGVGQRATLILVNGHRLAPSGSAGSYTDIMNIPLSAVDHIEMISDGASTIYGADAAGGIVNFVLRGAYSPMRTTASFGLAPGSLAGNDFSQSIPISGKKWHMVLAGEFYSRNGLPAADRKQATSNLTPWGGTDFSTPYGNPGTLLDEFRNPWRIPAGQDGTSLSAADLVPGMNTYDSYANSWVLPQQRRVNLIISGSYDVSDDTEITFEGLGNHRWIKTDHAPLTTALLVPSSNPFYVNPVPGSLSPVQVLYGFGDDFGSVVERGRIYSGQFTAGIDHRLSSDWHLEAHAGYTFENQLDSESNLANFDKLTEHLASTDRSSAFNPFGDGSHTSQETLDDIRADGSVNYRSAFATAGLKVVGSIPLLPAGPMTLIAGYDFRRQSFRSTTTPLFSSATEHFDTDRHRVLNAVYLQSNIPVWTMSAFSLKVAEGVRFEHFNDVGSALMPSFGMSLDIPHGWSFFGTWAHMFRPPNLTDLDESINYSAVIPLPDPTAPLKTTNALVWGGNNASLRPETARSWMLGGKFSPPSHPNVSIDAQYYWIKSFHQLLPLQFLTLDLFSNPQYNYLYTRNVTSSAVDHICSHSAFFGSPDQCQASNIGAIVDLRLRDAETIWTDGFDLNGLFRHDTRIGELSFHLQATYILHFKETQAPGSDFTSFRNTQHFPTALRFRSVFRWENRFLSVSPAINVHGGYKDTSRVPSRPVSAWTTWDLVVGYKANFLDDMIGGRTTLSLRGLNLSNRPPPFVNNQENAIGYDPENADLLGRRVSLRLEHEW